MACILVADDDDILIELLRFRLEAAGHDVLVSEDGGDALRKARALLPDLIILDAMMPVMQGHEVLRAIRADPVLATRPVVMLTSRKAESDVVTALRDGASDYLTKPFIPQELIVRVDRLLQAAGRRVA